jgi:LacI family transcriptional regulator
MPVSRIRRYLSNPKTLGSRTRIRIQEVIDGLGFQGESGASGAILQPPDSGVSRYSRPTDSHSDSRHIAVITPFSSALSFVERVRGVYDALNPDEFKVIQYNVETEGQLYHFLDALARPGAADGVIMMSLPLPDTAALRFQEQEIPLVTVERVFPGFSGVNVDNMEGGRRAASYMVNRGYRRPAFMGDGGNPDYAFNAPRLRFAGFKESLLEAGIPLPDRRVAFHKLGARNVPDVLVSLMKNPDPPDFLFCASDLEAIVAGRTARDLGLAVPGDLAILGFDNIELTDFLAISTVDQYLIRSGTDAANLLLRRMADRDSPPETIRYDLRIVERWTT